MKRTNYEAPYYAVIGCSMCVFIHCACAPYYGIVYGVRKTVCILDLCIIW